MEPSNWPDYISKSANSQKPVIDDAKGRLTVFRSEQRTDRTTCLSGHVVRYVKALVPLTGRISLLISS